MQNYHLDVLWKIDAVLLTVLAVFVISIVMYVFLQEYFLSIRRRKLSSIKNNIYALLQQRGEKAVCFAGTEKMTPQQFIDVVNNRSRSVVFFNEEEQAYFRRCFINQRNIVTIERIAKHSIHKWRRIEAMLALGAAEVSSALVVFEKGLFDRDPDISYFSLIALGQIKTDLSLKILLSFLKINTFKRHKVASVLENFPPFAADQIIHLVDDSDPELRVWAIRILSRFKPVRYIEKIRILSADNDPQVRAVACECLGALGGAIAQEALIQRLLDQSWLVRVQAAYALSQAMGADCVQHISRLLSDNSLNVITAVGDIVVKYSDVALPYLEKILVGDDVLAKRKAVEIMARSRLIEKLIRDLLNENSSEGRYQLKLIEVLLESGAHYSIESVVLALDAQERSTIIRRIQEVDDGFATYLIEKAKA